MIWPSSPEEVSGQACLGDPSLFSGCKDPENSHWEMTGDWFRQVWREWGDPAESTQESYLFPLRAHVISAVSQSLRLECENFCSLLCTCSTLSSSSSGL